MAEAVSKMVEQLQPQGGVSIRNVFDTHLGRGRTIEQLQGVQRQRPQMLVGSRSPGLAVARRCGLLDEPVEMQRDGC